MWFICMIFFPCVLCYVRFFRMDCGYDNSLPQHQMLVFRTEKGDKGERFSWMSPGFFIILIRFSSLIQARCYSLKFSPELWCDCFSLSQFYHLVFCIIIIYVDKLTRKSHWGISIFSFEYQFLSGGNIYSVWRKYANINFVRENITRKALIYDLLSFVVWKGLLLSIDWFGKNQLNLEYLI